MATLERLFVEYCVSGDVNSLTKILKENIIDIHTDNELGFRWAFTNANVQVIDFLLHIPTYLCYINNKFKFQSKKDNKASLIR